MNNNTDNPHLIDDLVSAIEKAITGYKEASKQTTIQILSESRLSELSQLITNLLDNKEPVPNELYHEWMQLVIMPKEKKEHPVQVPVLFTTEDGIGITDKGQEIFLVDDRLTLWNLNAASCSGDKEIKYFSTQEAAQTYCDLNRKSLSVNDINLHYGTNHDEEGEYIKIYTADLIELSKNNQQ